MFHSLSYLGFIHINSFYFYLSCSVFLWIWWTSDHVNSLTTSSYRDLSFLSKENPQILNKLCYFIISFFFLKLILIKPLSREKTYIAKILASLFEATIKNL